jgi:hypothetical protein
MKERRDTVLLIHSGCRHPSPSSPKHTTAELAALLARRDRSNCPVRPHLRLLGRHVECPNTRLPYSRCCGAKDEKAVAAAVAASPA